MEIEARYFPKFDRTPFAERIIKSLSDTPAGKANRTSITDVTWLGSPGTSSDLPKRIQVSRYEYATGLTWRTTIDMKSEKVVGYTADANRPTPLANDEVESAIKVASEHFPLIDQTPRLQINTVAMIQSSKGSPLYAHRLVAVSYEVAAPTRRLLVDLTMNKLVSKDF